MVQVWPLKLGKPRKTTNGEFRAHYRQPSFANNQVNEYCPSTARNQENLIGSIGREMFTTTEPVKNVATGKDHRVRLDMPEGMEYKHPEIAATGVLRSSGPIAFDTSRLVSILAPRGTSPCRAIVLLNLRARELACGRPSRIYRVALSLTVRTRSAFTYRSTSYIPQRSKPDCIASHSR